MSSISDQFIVGYRALGEYTGKPPQYWRNLASDGLLPFPKHKWPGHQVAFSKWDVKRYIRDQKGESGEPGPTLSLDRYDIHSRIMELTVATYELTEDHEALDRLIKTPRAEDAIWVRDRLRQALQLLPVLWMAAEIAAHKTQTPAGNQFNAKLRDEGDKAALRYIAPDFGHYLDMLKSIIDIDFYSIDGEALSEMLWKMRRRGLAD